MFRILLAASLVCWNVVAVADSIKPNVIFILADDLRTDAIGALGNDVVQTPNFDRLASNAFVFKNTYCFGSNSPAVCQPSRNMILSGNSYFRWKGERNAPAAGPSFPRSMANAGYETFQVSKSGNIAVELQKQFQTSHYLNDEQERTSGTPGKKVVDLALGWLENRKANDLPYFMYLAFEAPHDPRVAADNFRKRYTGKKIPLPANYLPVHPFDNGEMTIRDEKLAPWPRTKTEINRHLLDYYSVITGLDAQIGRLTDELKARGEYDRTIFIVSSDHGLAIGSHGLMGKQSLYDHSMKSPLFFTGPGISKGSSDALVYLLDIFPTVVELVGSSPPSQIDGQSLVPIIQDSNKVVRDDLFLAYRDVQRAIIADGFKLIQYPKINRTQLFDLVHDPDELNDLSTNMNQSMHIESMMKLLKKRQNDFDDDVPLRSTNPASDVFAPPVQNKS